MAEETAAAQRAQAGSQRGAGTSKQEKAHQGNTNNQGEDQQQIRKETQNETDLEFTAQLERAKVVQAKTSGRRGRMAGARRLRPGLPPAAPLLLRRSSPPTPARFRPSQTLLRLRRQRKNNAKGRGVGTGGLSWRFGAGTPAGPSRSRGAAGEAVRQASPPAARAQALRREVLRHAAPLEARVPRANS